VDRHYKCRHFFVVCRHFLFKWRHIYIVMSSFLAAGHGSECFVHASRRSWTCRKTGLYTHDSHLVNGFAKSTLCADTMKCYQSVRCGKTGLTCFATRGDRHRFYLVHRIDGRVSIGWRGGVSIEWRAASPLDGGLQVDCRAVSGCLRQVKRLNKPFLFLLATKNTKITKKGCFS